MQTEVNPAHQTHTSILIADLKRFYQHMDASRLQGLSDLYTADIEFRDPVHTIHGLLGLKHYFHNLMLNTQDCSFSFIDELVGEDTAYLSWEMQFSHTALSGGKPITVRGMSQLRFSDKIFYHEDCYDMGAMLYEQLPVLGNVTRWLKHRIAS